MAAADMHPSLPELAPGFALYGEPPRRFADDYLHLEPLETRCRGDGWWIKLHRHDALHQLIHVARGAVEARLGAEEASFDGPSLIVVPAGSVHSFRFTPDTAGVVMSLSALRLQSQLLREPSLHGLFTRAERIDARGVSDRLSQRLGSLQSEMEQQAAGWEAVVAADLIGVLVLTLRARGEQGPNGRLAVGQDARLVARLREQIEARFRTHASVDDYAAALAVSASRLRSACLRVTGRSVTALVHERLMSLARHALTTSELTIYEIAYDLGFEDVAYFSRFFSKKEGCSPSHYRAGLKKSSLMAQ